MKILNKSSRIVSPFVENLEYQVATIDYEQPLPNTMYNYYVGIDPGTTKFGVAVLEKSSAYITAYQFYTKRINNTGERIKFFFDLFQHFYTELSIHNAYFIHIEGASFGNMYRQVELAEVRTAAVVAALVTNNGIPKIIPPRTIKKKVFGSGKISAHNFWECLTDMPDAAAALSCAIYGMMMDEQTGKTT